MVRSLRPTIAPDGRLADRLHERRVERVVLPGPPAILADADLPALRGAIVIPHDLRLTPVTAAIRGALQEQVDVAAVAGGVVTAFTKGQDCAFAGDGQRRNAIGVLATLATGEDPLAEGRWCLVRQN